MPIQEAVVRRRCIHIQYDAGGHGELTKRTVEALGLLYYGRHWHLVAWCRLRNAFRDFRLDRIREWEVSKEVFTGHENFSLSDFIEQEIDICQRTPVEIECEPWILDRVLQEAPCNIASKQSLENGNIMIHAQAYSLEWLARWLIGLGTAAIARHPDELGSLIAAEATSISGLYQKN